MLLYKYLLFKEFLYCIGPQYIIMHSNPMPLSRFWQILWSLNSLVKHAPCPNCKDGYISTIPQYLLNRGLANFSTNNCLLRKTAAVKLFVK